MGESHWTSRFLSLSRFAFFPLIAAGVLFAWQGFVTRVQYFDVVSTSHTSPTIAVTIERFVRHALGLAPPTSYEIEQQMNAGELMDRWTPLVRSASQRFGVPESWVRTVMQMESGGRTLSGENQPIVSRAGAMGLMQLMPGTWQEMRTQLGLGTNPFDPHDNVFAGVAYLKWLHGRYGYPAMFAAYNDGPGNFEARIAHGQSLPQETQNYVSRIAATLGGRLTGAMRGVAGVARGQFVKFTRPNGSSVGLYTASISKVRAPLPNEYAPGVNAVIVTGTQSQGVRETVASVSADLRAHGAHTLPKLVLASADERHGLFLHRGRISVSYSMQTRHCHEACVRSPI